MEEQDLESVMGGGWLMEAGEGLAAAGQADLRSGTVKVGVSGVEGSGTAIIGFLELVAGGWLMIGGTIADAFD